ncbi:MAG: hypothetical protein KJ658_21855, partial [Proteobacteria bacterium]|nr:hypothetical protein [Pseudomonadota bacterium]
SIIPYKLMYKFHPGDGNKIRWALQSLTSRTQDKKNTRPPSSFLLDFIDKSDYYQFFWAIEAFNFFKI